MLLTRWMRGQQLADYELRGVCDEAYKIRVIADTMGIYERRTGDGQRYFVVKYGMLVVAVIMALEIQKELVSELEDLAACCRVAYAYQNK